MGQVSIKVDAGTGNPVDFSQTTSAQNYRQAVTIGDPLVDANYLGIANGAANVVGTMAISGTPNVAVTNNPVLGAGSNLIGTVQMSGSLPSGSNVVGTFQILTGSRVASSNETGSVYNGLTAISPSFGSISFSANGNNVVVGTVTSKIIRVLAMNFIVGTATNVYFTDSTSGMSVWGGSTNNGQFSANSGIVLPYCPIGHFQTSAGNALIANISATSSVAGSITYITI